MKNIGIAFENMKEKKLFLLGDGRAAMDFLYLFNVSVSGCVRIRGEEHADFLQHMVIGENELSDDWVHGKFFIICSHRQKHAERILLRRGLTRYTDYIFDIDYAKILDFGIGIITYKKIIFWATAEEEQIIKHIDEEIWNKWFHQHCDY